MHAKANGVSVVPTANAIFAGIDLSSSRSEFAYAALDGELNVVALGDADMEQLLAILTQPGSAVVAVNAPSALNQGILRERMRMQVPAPRQLRGAEMRVAEHELRALGISVAGTPTHLERCPGWMRSGFELFARLRMLGFETAPAGESARQVLETHPEACFFSLLGKSPFPKPALEGRLQRQLVLFESGLRIRDPMNFFEELTRHKLLRGLLPTDEVYAPERLDALAAAYAAWLCTHVPGRVSWLGEAGEGKIALPAPPGDAHGQTG
jgi:predicted nuclease with RNAse H fold